MVGHLASFSFLRKLHRRVSSRNRRLGKYLHSLYVLVHLLLDDDPDSKTFSSFKLLYCLVLTSEFSDFVVFLVLDPVLMLRVSQF